MKKKRGKSSRGGPKTFNIVGIGEHWRNFRCRAIGVHSSQVDDANDDCVRMGLRPCFEKGTGDAVFNSRREYNDYLRAKRLFNKDAGYGDAAPP